MKSFVPVIHLLAAAGPAAAVPFPWHGHHGHHHPSYSAAAPPVYTASPPTSAQSWPGASSATPSQLPSHSQTYSPPFSSYPAASSGFPTLSVPASSGISFPVGTGSAPASTGTVPTYTSVAGTPYSSSQTYSPPFSSPSASSGFPTLSVPTSSGISVPTGTGSAPLPTGTSPSGPVDDSFLRGINVGNWLVLEKWMDQGQSAFKGAFAGATDQWSFDSIDGAEAALKEHWDSWFTEIDVQKLKGFGFNALRIPIGYWAYKKFDDDKYITGADEYVEKAVGWARNAGMRVLLDLHGLPGSQNGQDHSGHAGAIEWQQNDNLNKSTEVVVLLAQKYGTNAYSDVVYGIETVNEPTANSPNNFQTSKQWSLDAYNAAQKVIENKNLKIYTHDSFTSPKNFIDIGSGLKTFGVDQHDYQLYTDADNALDQAGHIKKACGWASDLATTKASMPVMVGEWSAVTSVCVNSDGSTTAGSSCSGDSQGVTSTDVSEWNAQTVEQVRRYVEAQLDVYEQNTSGYFVWSYKGPGSWGPENLIANGAWPQPLTDRKYPGQCS